MNQYIITENLLDRLYDAGYSRGCMERDEEHNKKLGVLYKEAESHPYNPQAEREKVLKEVITEMEKYHTQCTNTYLDVIYEPLLQIVKELRTKGGERG